VVHISIGKALSISHDSVDYITSAGTRPGPQVIAFAIGKRCSM